SSSASVTAAGGPQPWPAGAPDVRSSSVASSLLPSAENRIRYREPDRSRPRNEVSLVVQKFGGTSVADPDRIRAVADHVARIRREGHDVVVVVSAMGKTTDDLIRLAQDVCPDPAGREMDMLLTAGERISMALLCMAIETRGVPAASFTGSQAGIVTDTSHGKARILEVRGDRLRDAIATGRVAVVAGFQGVSTERDVTTLGRG